jgi:hypothetical protein
MDILLSEENGICRSMRELQWHKSNLGFCNGIFPTDKNCSGINPINPKKLLKILITVKLLLFRLNVACSHENNTKYEAHKLDEKIAANTTLCGHCCTKHKNKPSFAHDHICLSNWCIQPK